MLDLMTAGAKLRDTAREHEAIDAGQPVEVDLQPRQMFAQGDVGILRLEKLPKGARKVEMPAGGQVAPGNTQGSRHCIRESDWGHVTIYQIDDGDQLSNLAVVATQPWMLTHPEHANVTLTGVGERCYRLLHEQNEQRERVVD